MARPIITLTTDFGMTDPFVGAMKGVILSIAPDATVVDLVHTVPPQNIPEGAYLLGTAYRYFPEHTIHVVVVDPGVGTERAPIAVVTGRETFVCPDNGLLSYVLAHAGIEIDEDPFAHNRTRLPEGWAAFHLTDEKYWLKEPSTTFHGRDVFAPSAAFIAQGVQPWAIGEQIAAIDAFAIPKVVRRGDEAVGNVVHVDGFGNLITNIKAADLPPEPLWIEVQDQGIDGISGNYQARAGLVAVMGSSGTLEIALSNGNAARMLRAAHGTDVRVRGRG